MDPYRFLRTCTHLHMHTHTVHAVLVIIERLVYCSQCSFLYGFEWLEICKCTNLQCLYVEQCFYEIVCNKLLIQLGRSSLSLCGVFICELTVLWKPQGRSNSSNTQVSNKKERQNIY